MGKDPNDLIGKTPFLLRTISRHSIEKLEIVMGTKEVTPEIELGRNKRVELYSLTEVAKKDLADVENAEESASSSVETETNTGDFPASPSTKDMT